MSDLTALPLAEARARLRAGEISPVELTGAYLSAIEAAGELNAYVRVCADHARAMARRAEARLLRGKGGDGGGGLALDGVPLGVKDMFCTKGVETNAGSRILEGFVPPYESTATRKLWEAGAVLLGKLNTDEFAMGSSNETSCHGPVVNPWREEGSSRALTPGGSSGGPAAAVAAQLCAGAAGTDTGGSIRQPAAFTGIVGVKPTYGRVSRRGIVAFASSLDQAGPLARSVRDAAILLEAMSGHDPQDATSADRPVPSFEKACGQPLGKMRIGIPAEYRMPEMPAEIEEVWRKGIDLFRAAGAELVEVSLPRTAYALPAYYIIALAEASSNLARYDGVRYGRRRRGEDILGMYEKTRAEGFGAEVKRRILIGTHVLSQGYYDAYYLKAQKVRSLIAREFSEAFAGADVLLTPATPGPAFGLGERISDPVAMYLNDIFTVPANLAGLPAMTLPAGLSRRGLPLALQLIAPAFAEERLFRAGRALEEAVDFTARPRPWWRRKK